MAVKKAAIEVLIMDTKQGVLDILNDLTGEDLSDQMG